MAITVFGGKGFVGSRFCQTTPDVIIKERNDYSVDLTKSTDIFYLISTVDNYNVFTDPFLDIQTNLVCLMHTLQSIKQQMDQTGIKDVTFNFVSSWFVYGNVELPAKEDALCDPKGFYSITKRTAEQLIISYCETFGINYRILRLGNVLGEQDTKVSAKKNALQYLINELKEGNPIKLYDGGEVYRDYIYIDDAINAMKWVLGNDSTKNQIYNIGNGEKIYLKDAIQYAKHVLKSKSEINFIEAVDFHKTVQTKNMVLDVSKIKELGYVQQYSIYDIIDILTTKKQNVTEKYGIKMLFDQFGKPVPQHFEDPLEKLLIDKFEQYVLELKSENKENYTMLELGSNFAYYSMLFKKILGPEKTTNFMLEPDKNIIQRGMAHFYHNNLQGYFINARIYDETAWKTFDADTKDVTVDDIFSYYSLDDLDLLHMDIDQAEMFALNSAKHSLQNKKIDTVFILTHPVTEEEREATHRGIPSGLHRQCRELMLSYDYNLVFEHIPSTICGDALLIFKR